MLRNYPADDGRETASGRYRMLAQFLVLMGISDQPGRQRIGSKLDGDPDTRLASSDVASC